MNTKTLKIYLIPYRGMLFSLTISVGSIISEGHIIVVIDDESK